MVSLGRWQLGCLAAAVFVVSAGYGALMPVLPAWLLPLMPADDKAEVARHVGLLSGAYTAGLLVGAPLWGMISDRVGRRRILLIGLVGYVLSLLPLLWPEWTGLAGIYALRAATGFFVAAVVLVVPALVAEYTPEDRRARRFAWLGAMSLLGFLFGPGLNAVASRLSSALTDAGAGSYAATDLVILLAALLGGLMMLGLAASLPSDLAPTLDVEQAGGETDDKRRAIALWVLNGVVMFVLAGFELGIVLQGQQHPTLSSREISLMFAECSLVMLVINAMLFFTGLLERAAGRGVLAAGLVLAIAGLAMLALHRSDAWMYVGVSLTAAGTGLVLPTISFLAAGASRRRLGATMGGLASAAGFGQTIGSAATGWMFGAVAQTSFAWLALPLLATLALLLVRPARWFAQDAAPAPQLSLRSRPSGPSQEP
ncbi:MULTISPECIES: MFS transporter [Comamonadaceae]|uniref:Major facilitator superfamily MFS_1 n=1 Tax=Alicycliphilus denitrificans (strain DSM 14773 / CIP 107495 / K601) TaxID=596154 RepID=F4G9X3_ALIDK|nr:MULTISPECIES: MFS transporter [Comamonadaceae]AEB85705.1 major facilitator superfamily MFS_1 [Alicycliphilus denitrificans K601]